LLYQLAQLSLSNYKLFLLCFYHRSPVVTTSPYPSKGRRLKATNQSQVTLRLYVLVSSPLCGRLIRYCFLFKCLVLEFVLSLWGALSDERSCLWLRVTLRVTVSQYVLVSSPLCGRLTRYCFLFKSLGLEFVVLSLWGTLSDQRPGLSFVNHSLVCTCTIYIFIFHTFTIYI
jgi:hypothetical protein